MAISGASTFRSSDDTAWTVEKIATFTDKLNGNAQAVTTPPQIEIDIANGVDRWVFIGTGRLLDDTDLTTPAIANQIQTMYAIRDGTAAGADHAVAGNARSGTRICWR